LVTDIAKSVSPIAKSVSSENAAGPGSGSKIRLIVISIEPPQNMALKIWRCQESRRSQTADVANLPGQRTFLPTTPNLEKEKSSKFTWF
jgi:hypothetical protein